MSIFFCSKTSFKLTSQTQIEALGQCCYKLSGWGQEDAAVQSEMQIDGYDVVFDDCFCIGDYFGWWYRNVRPIVEQLAFFLAKAVHEESFKCESGGVRDGGAINYDIAYNDGILRIGRRTTGSMYYYVDENTKVMFAEKKGLNWFYHDIKETDDCLNKFEVVNSFSNNPDLYVCGEQYLDSGEANTARSKGINVISENELYEMVAEESDDWLWYAIVESFSIEQKPFIYESYIITTE